MARSFANAKVLFLIILDGISNTLTRRGYAAATKSATKGGVVSTGNNIGPTKTREDVTSTYNVSWVPDPVTGYYRPENVKDTTDAIDLHVASTYNVSWVPDPLTGYYRPENVKDTIDAVDLRDKLLPKKLHN